MDNNKNVEKMSLTVAWMHVMNFNANCSTTIWLWFSLKSWSRWQCMIGFLKLK